eukprot:GHUV01014342.1.p1 GENE.GHUV01014342.1~~GHUV01014342.1.p1  ORF type:complete len:1302 (+),score=516.71 GHUV01014342.1:511-3906(+)
MPPDLGLLLHNRLEALMRDRVVLGTNAHLLYVLLPDPLFSINDWNQWQRLAADMTAQHRLIASTEQIDIAYIQRRCGGMRGDAATDARHARFAAAMLLDLVVSDASCVLEVESTWGKRDSLTKMGITRGQLQAWQLEVSRTAAMAALLTSNAGWWQLETLLAPLAAQAAAGVRPELLPLMQVSGVQPAHAFALHAAGFLTPDLLVSASESEIAAALAAKLPNMRKRKTKDKSGLDLQPGRTALVSRASKAILASARQHAVQSATAAAGDLQETTDDTSKVEQLSLQQRQFQLRPIHGQATVHQVFPQQDDPLLNQLLDAWQLQPSFSFAVVVDPQRCAAQGCRLSSSQAAAASPAATYTATPGANNTPMAAAATAAAVDGSPCCVLHCQRPVALVLCWTDKDAAVLRLPAPEAAGTAVASRVWGTIRSVFGDAERTATCCGAAAAVAALAAAGVKCRLAVDDPCAAFLLWQPAACEQLAQEQQQQAQQASQPMSQLALAMKAAHRMVLGDAYKLQIPIGPSSAQTEATRAVLLAKALMPPLRALLAKQQLWQLYEEVERPLQLIMATVRSSGLRVAPAAVEEQRQQCQHYQQVLQQHVQRGSGGLDISSAAQVRMFLSRCRLVPAGSELKDRPILGLLLKAVRTAIRQKQQHMLPLLHPICTYWQCGTYEQQLEVLLQHTADAGSLTSGSKQVLLQPLPSITELAGRFVQGYPGQLGSAISHTPVVALPLAMTEVSLEDEGFTAVSAAVPVVMLLPTQSQHEQRYQEVSGVLRSLSSQASGDQGSQLPLHGRLEDGAPSYMGHVQYWCSVTLTAREQQLLSSAIHGLRASRQSWQQQHQSWSLLPGTLSLASAVQPSAADHMFVGVQLQQLPLVVLAALSQDPALLYALNQPDPSIAAAQHWLRHGGLPPTTVELLLRHVAAGSAAGVPVPPSDAEQVLFTMAMNALLLGQKPSMQRDLLALEQKGINLVTSLLQAFPGLSAWQQRALEKCSKHGCLQSLLGRKITFKMPTGSTGPSSRESRALSEAQGMACSLATMASVHDAECLTAAALQEQCCRSGLGNCFVAFGDRQVVLEVPAASALSFLRAAVPAVHADVIAKLGLQQGCSVRRLPLRWWWGSSLDILVANWFSL